MEKKNCYIYVYRYRYRYFLNLSKNGKIPVMDFMSNFEGKEKFHSFKPAPRRSTLKDTIFQSFYENKLRLL